MTDALSVPPHARPRTAIRYSFAFQPIFDVVAGVVVSHEALIRGPGGEPAGSVLSQVAAGERHHFDRDARLSALELAMRLGLTTDLNLDLSPRSLLMAPDAVMDTIAAAERLGLDPSRLILELTEGEFVHDRATFTGLLDDVRRRGPRVAIDDFGDGYAGLVMLTEFLPDILKLDAKLMLGIESSGARQAIVRAVIQACLDLGIDVVADGVETVAEHRWLENAGVRFIQGPLLGRPAFEALGSTAR